jgi:hypothetical protein
VFAGVYQYTGCSSPISGPLVFVCCSPVVFTYMFFQGSGLTKSNLRLGGAVN